jgi:hypothetical protein
VAMVVMSELSIIFVRQNEAKELSTSPDIRERDRKQTSEQSSRNARPTSAQQLVVNQETYWSVLDDAVKLGQRALCKGLVIDTSRLRTLSGLA